MSPSSVAQRPKIEDTRQAPYQKARYAIFPFRDDRSRTRRHQAYKVVVVSEAVPRVVLVGGLFVDAGWCEAFCGKLLRGTFGAAATALVRKWARQVDGRNVRM